MKKPAFSDADAGVMMVLLGTIFSGLRPLFGRWLISDDLSAVVIALYTYVASMLLFLPVGLRESRTQSHLKRTALICVGCGLFVGIGGLTYFEALRRLPVATVTLIFFTYPAMVLTIVALLQRRWPQPSAVLAIVLVLIGCSLIIGPEWRSSNSRWMDYAIAFISPASWTLLLLLLAGPLTTLSPLSRIGLISSGATIAMVAVVFIWPPTVYLPQSISGWLGFVGLVTLSGVLTHILYTLGVPKAGPERASISGVFEVATALAVGWMVLLEPVKLLQCVGIVLIGIALILSRHFDSRIGDAN